MLYLYRIEILKTLLALWLLIFNASFGFAIPVSLSEKENTVSIAVMGINDFIPDAVSNAAQNGIPEALASRVIQQLGRSERFKILDRTVLRRSIIEQRFGQDKGETDLDRVVDKAVTDMPNVDGLTVAASGLLGASNDSLKDFKDLGSAVGADYIVYMKAEQLSSATTAVGRPYSDTGKQSIKNEMNASLSVRIIEVAKSRIVGAVNINTLVVERGEKHTPSLLKTYDAVAIKASNKIIDMIFPAKVVNEQPWVLNRGSNDLVSVGDFYELLRNGKEITNESGIVIGRIQTPVGTIKLINVQDNLSVFEVVSGTPKNGDLVTVLSSNESNNELAKPAVLNGQSSIDQKRPRIAIGLVKAHSTATTGLDASAHIPVFTDSLLTRLAQTKRFTVIDRQEVDQLLNEQLAQALTDNKSLPSEMGQLKGADYLVYGSVSSFMFKEISRSLPGSGRVLSHKEGMVEGNMRIVNALSGEVMESRKVSVKQNIEVSISEARMVTLLANAYAEQVTMQLMQAVYPIKIASVSGDETIYINRGKDGGLFLQEVLRAYQLGEPVLDPDTGIQLGRTEMFIGDVLITEVDESRSKGTSLQVLSLKPGVLLKRKSGNKNVLGGSLKQQEAVRSGVNLATRQKGKAALAIGQVLINPAGKNQFLFGPNLERVNNDLYVKLTQSNRFDVLERSQIDQVLDQKTFTAIAKGDDISSSLSELQGADYLIHATVDDFYIETENKYLSTVNRTQIRHVGKSNASVRIIDIHTGRTISAEKIVLEYRLNDSDDKNQVLNQLVHELTTKIVSGVINHIYPIKVMGVTSGGKIYINRGSSSGVKVGELYMVSRLGKELIDPDTGISFGQEEADVGKVKVQVVETGKSVAKTISGGNITAGDILRKVQRAVSATPIKKVRKPTF